MQKSHGQFHVGRSYEVVKAFHDYDGVEIAAGTRFTIVRLDFLPYEDGLTLTGDFAHTGLATLQRRVLRLQDRPEAQAGIIDPGGGYVVMAKAAR
jgi:hypothetical protein